MPVKRWSLVWPVLATMVIPLIASWFMYPATHLPPDFGVFPPIEVQPAPGFWLPAFVVVGLVCLAITAFLVFPTWFGFKSPGDVPPPPTPVSFPWWFWAGLVVTLFFWWLMWARFTVFGTLVYYAFTPLWWGFIVTLDGWVYRRMGGRSLLATRPHTMAISAFVSVFGWYYFEYIDYFVLGNWYYPNGHMPELSHAMIVALFLIAYTTVWPAIFEWYTLLKSFPRFAARYAQGPKLALNGGWLMGIGFVLIGAMVFFPYPLFWVVWVGPLIVLSGQMLRLGVWTPFSSLAQGNWTPFVLAALASLFNGFFWEVWNWGSAQPEGLAPTNPNYWIYNIPYVDVIHIYAEMPLLGFFGYLPFGVLVWVVFLWAGKLCGFDASLSLDPVRQTALPVDAEAVPGK